MPEDCRQRHGNRQSDAETKAAAALAPLMRREYGLSSTDIVACLQGDVLTVRLGSAISAMGLAVLHEDGGDTVLRSVYVLLHDINRSQADALISGVLGRAVRHSTVELDAAAGDVLLAFHL